MAEDREIKQTEDTILVVKGKVSLLAFPDSVMRCVVDDGIDAVISGQNVYITAKKAGRVFVSLPNLTVPLVLRFSTKAPASYNFHYRGIERYADTSFYNEIAALISALYHEEVITNYAMRKPEREIKLKLGEKKYKGKVSIELLGNYFGYVLTFKKSLDSIPENLFWQPGVVAVATDGKRAFMVANRELFPKKEQ